MSVLGPSGRRGTRTGPKGRTKRCSVLRIVLVSHARRRAHVRRLNKDGVEGINLSLSCPKRTHVGDATHLSRHYFGPQEVDVRLRLPRQKPRSGTWRRRGGATLSPCLLRRPYCPPLAVRLDPAGRASEELSATTAGGGRGSQALRGLGRRRHGPRRGAPGLARSFDAALRRPGWSLCVDPGPRRTALPDVAAPSDDHALLLSISDLSPLSRRSLGASPALTLVLAASRRQRHGPRVPRTDFTRTEVTGPGRSSTTTKRGESEPRGILVL